MAVGTWPQAFAAKQMAVTDGTQYVRLGGKGPAVLLLHGFGDTGDMWVTLPMRSLKTTPSSFPTCEAWACRPIPRAVTKRSRRLEDLIGILDQLGFQEVALVTHDIGNMVGYAFAASQIQASLMSHVGPKLT